MKCVFFNHKLVHFVPFSFQFVQFVRFTDLGDLHLPYGTDYRKGVNIRTQFRPHSFHRKASWFNFMLEPCHEVGTWAEQLAQQRLREILGNRKEEDPANSIPPQQLPTRKGILGGVIPTLVGRLLVLQKDASCQSPPG